MKKDGEKSLCARAKECRRNAQACCDNLNDEAKKKALEDFKQSEIAEYFRENASYVTGLVVSRLNDMHAGKPTSPFRLYDGETLIRLLSTSTVAVYDGWGIDKSLDDEETVQADEDDSLVRGNFSDIVLTPATEAQDKLRDALLEYAKQAAVSAKRIGSPSLIDWAGMIDILENKCVVAYLPQIGKDDALRLVELHNAAVDRLRLDKIIAALPPPPRKAARKAR